MCVHTFTLLPLLGAVTLSVLVKECWWKLLFSGRTGGYAESDGDLCARAAAAL